jgi:hypothetical protein
MDIIRFLITSLLHCFRQIILILLLLIIISNSHQFSWFQKVRVTYQALFSHYSPKDVITIWHVLSVTALCIRIYVDHVEYIIYYTICVVNYYL